MDTIDIVSIGIALLAVGLSVAVFVRDNHRYHIPLQIRVIPSFVVAWHKGNQSLVLFRLIFVNHSLRGRAGVSIKVGSLNYITGTPVAWLYDEDYQNVTARLPNSEKSKPLPVPEVLHSALDIPPHQSQCKWVGYLLQVNEDLAGNIDSCPIVMVAIDINDEELARCEILVSLSDLKNPGVYLALTEH